MIYLNSKFVRRPVQKPNRYNNDANIKKFVQSASWFEIPHNEKRWIINIRNIDGDENKLIKSFEGTPNDYDNLYLDDNLSRFANIILGKTEKYHHDNFKKCVPCEFASICQFSLKHD